MEVPVTGSLTLSLINILNQLNGINRCGDVHLQPGSTRKVRFPCTFCDKTITARSKAVDCRNEWTLITYNCNRCILEEILPKYRTDEQRV